MKTALPCFVVIGSLVLSVLTTSCDTSAISKAAPANSEDGSVSYVDALARLGLDKLEADAFYTDDLLKKYDVIKSEYNDYAFSSTLRSKIILIVVERGNYKDDRIEFLLKELDDFGLPYPKESFILLQEAKTRGVLTEAEVHHYGRSLLKKALKHADLWEHTVNCEVAPEAEDKSVSASIYRGLEERAIYTEKLKIYSED